ncbi:MAG: response regulator transcription factor [Nitrosomonas sp.]|nr:response regulator transcription factor [Nitrosomonas sp.]MDP1951277.1 response regulator transcription factor [Nitrosomonas sp.]
MVIRVLIVDDHTLFRDGIKRIFEETSDIVIAAEARNARAALKAGRDCEWDVMILDINLPDMNGLEVLKRLKAYKLSFQILVLSMYPEDEYAIRALRTGASAYLTKDCSIDLLLSVIRRLAAGGRYVSQELAEKLLFDDDCESRVQPHLSFSDRELHIFKLICAGEPLTSIGLKLSISIKTVSTYRTRILKKMGMKNNLQLFQYATEHKLLE